LVFDVARRLAPRAVKPFLKRLHRWIAHPERPVPWFSDAFRRRALKFANDPVDLGDGFRSAHAESLYLETRSKYHVHCMEWNNKCAARFGLDMAFPFLDRDLIAFLMAVPGEIQTPGGVPRALLREAMAGVLPEPVRARTWKADFSTTINRGIGQELEQLSARLTGGALSVRLGYVDERRLVAALPALARELEGPTSLATWDLADLFALEVWLGVFFGEGPALGLRPSQPILEGPA
jgi:hypothetical protein